MQDDAVKSRLIPQFSIRWLFAVTAIVAVAFSIVGLAVRGSDWAAALSFGMASLVILILTYALMFWAVWVFSVVYERTVASRSRGWSSPLGLPVAPNNGSASPFAPAGRVLTSAPVEAVLVETPGEPARPNSEASDE